MKQLIWILCGIFLSGLLLGSLSACGAGQASGVSVTERPSSQETEEDDKPNAAPAEETVPEEGAAPMDEKSGETARSGSAPQAGSAALDGETARQMAFGKVLWDAYQQGVLPDGKELDRPGGSGTLSAPIEGNKFALCDVDGDGAEELLLSWTTASMAGTVGIVFGYAEEAVYEELTEFPSMRFYDNGAVEADWSHNQGWGGRFWPYTLYRYNYENGLYESVGSVDAWDRSCTEETYPDAFPTDIDADGDGLVFYINANSGAWNQRQYTTPGGDTYYTWDIEPVDNAAHQAWLNSYTGGADMIDIHWQELTEENIEALGCPKPDVEYPEPLG